MKHLLLILQIGFLSSMVCYAKTGNNEPTQCSDDENEWGNPTKCSCVQKYEYVAKLGLCMETAKWHPKDVHYQGILRASISGPGGETTGIGIEINNAITDLVLRTADRERLQAFDGRKINIEGQEIILPGVEPHGPRGWVAVIVNKVGVLD